MALENIAEIEKALGIDEGKFSEMINSEEKHTIDISNKIILDKETYEERVSNIKKEEFKHGQDKFFKTVRDSFGLEITGKTAENLIDGLKTYVDSEKEKGGAEPEEKYKSLKTDFEKLQANLISKESEFETFKTNINVQNELNEIKNDFTKNIKGETIVSKSTIFTEAKEKGFRFEREEGKTVVKDLNGEIVKDQSTFSPVSIDAWVKEFAQPYLKQVEGGGGWGDNDNPAKAGTFEAFEKEAEKKGWNQSEMNAEMSRRINDKTLVI
jgi:hypothetical protein